MTAPRNGRVLVLGLDGATFDGLRPLAAAGVLPTLGALMREGAVAPMRTVFPPVTAPAWLALATGLNPGKTGVYDYVNRSGPFGTGLQPVSSADYRGRAIWDLLGRSGFKVGIFNYPTLSPPPEVAGFAVTGMGGYRKHRLCFPATLEGELHRVTGGFENSLNLRNPLYRRDIGAFFRDIERILSKQSLALKYLMGIQEWDFLVAVLSVTDWMQHVLWKYIDEGHPDHDRESAAPVQSRYHEVWRKIDSLVGELRASMPAGTNLVIVSDHGSGPLDSVFYPNAWLEQQGWVTRRRSWRADLARWLGLFDEGGDRKFASRARTLVRHRILRLANSVELIDHDRSLAYSPEHNTMFGCINLTEAGRARRGFADQLAAALRALPLTVAGIDAVEVYLPGQLFSGPFLDHAPDILFVVNGYRSTVEIGFAPRPFVPRASMPLRTGGHRPEGVFIAEGLAFRSGWRGECSILDIAPTLLALYGARIPASMDGKVLLDSLAAPVAAGLELRQSNETVAARPEGSGEDMDEMKDILRSLGYL